MKLGYRQGNILQKLFHEIVSFMRGARGGTADCVLILVARHFRAAVLDAPSEKAGAEWQSRVHLAAQSISIRSR